MSAGVTPLELALENGHEEPRATPRDALRLARDAWVHGRPVDMGALAEELGVSRATLYRWVGSKERLLGEVVWSFAAGSWEHALAVSRGTGPDYVAEAIERYLRTASESPALRRFIEHDPEYALRVMTSRTSPMQRRSIAATRELLVEQTESGALAPPLAPDALAYLIVRIGESFLYSDVITGDEHDIEPAIDAIHALLHAPPTKRRRPRR